jgi:CubicO group peptidase (beta-lactamase class C family)
MKLGLLLSTILVLASTAATVLHAGAAAQPTVKRLDGTTISTAEIDATVARLMKAAEVPGTAIAILNDGKIAYLKAYGFRNKEKTLPLTVDSVMSAASLSKVAFTYAALQLVDEGVLDLDRPVYQYLPKPLPEYPNYADLANDPRYKRITARMLLSHTSGFANWRWFEDDRKLRIHFEPGSRYAYSGEGIALLQLVVETITKKPLEETMQQRVFQPLGMTRTSMVWQDRFDSDYADGYDEYGRSLGPLKQHKAGAAGSMSTTIADFARFMQAVLEGRWLRPKTREQMLSPQIQIVSKHMFPTLSEETTDQNKAIRLSSGLGWTLYWTPYGEAFTKGGHDDGWRHYTVCFDQPKTGIVIMTNSGNGEGIFSYLQEALLKNTFAPTAWENYTPYDKLPPRAPLPQHKPVAVDAKVLDRYVGRYAIPPDVTLTIRREGDHLSIQESVQGNDEPKQYLLPESETDFFSTSADDAYTFKTDAKGHVTGMTLHTDGKDIPIKRVD